MSRPVFAAVAITIATLAHGQTDRPQLRAKMCAPLTLAQCEQQAQVCLDLSLDMREPFSSFTSVVGCAGQNGIGFLALGFANSAAKTNREILRDAGATPQQARAITRCVLKNMEFAGNNNDLNVNKVKRTIVPIIQNSIRKQSQREATLNAVNGCTAPTIDTMRDYVLCIAERCIKAR